MIYLITYLVFFCFVWCYIGWSMYHAPTDVDLWDEEIE